jgi:hypothetical protein
LKVKLAHEKSAKAVAQADLQALKDQHQAALMTAQQESAKATEEHLATKDALLKAQADLQALEDQHQATLMTAQQESAKATEEHLATKDALLKAQAEAAAHKAAADTKQQTSEADYMDMHDSLTQLVEEAEKKAADKEALVKELEANLKVKDAEIAELKVNPQIFIYTSSTHQCTP